MRTWICEHCGRVYRPHCGSLRQRFCSRGCYGAWRRSLRVIPTPDQIVAEMREALARREAR